MATCRPQHRQAHRPYMSVLVLLVLLRIHLRSMGPHLQRIYLLPTSVLTPRPAHHLPMVVMLAPMVVS